MKSILYTTAILACMGILSCQQGNGSPATSTAMVTVIDDQTDLRLLKLMADPILSLYQFQVHLNREAFFRYTFISDKRLNSTVDLHIESGKETAKQNRYDDPEYREKLVAKFYKKIRSVIADARKNPDSATIPYSECYRIISNEIIALAHAATGNKYLVVYSDLLEKSDIFNCYASDCQLLMKTSAHKIADRFQKAVPLRQNLSDITIIFVFSARNREEEMHFLEMTEVYKAIVEPLHGKILIQTTSNHFNL